jgi:hypothetical protein
VLADLIIVVACLWLLFYWGARTLLVFHSTQEAIDEALTGDLGRGRKLLRL